MGITKRLILLKENLVNKNGNNHVYMEGLKMAYNYEKYDTRKLVEIWCFNSNEELTEKIKRILEGRGMTWQRKT